MFITKKKHKRIINHMAAKEEDYNNIINDQKELNKKLSIKVAMLEGYLSKHIIDISVDNYEFKIKEEV